MSGHSAFQAARHTDRGSRSLERAGMSMTVSDGEVMCCGCWYGSGCNVDADVDVPAGEQAWWICTSTMYGEWEARCRRCAFGTLRDYAGPWPGDRLPRKPRSFMWPLNLRRVPTPC